VKDAELVALVGPNGAGKTTLLKTVAGLIEPSAGRATVCDLEPWSCERAELAKALAYLPQHYQLSFPFTALEVVLMGRYAHGRRGLLGMDTDEDRRRAREALERCDVLDLADRRLSELSGGEMRRVLLAQALCQDARLLLLDEPTAGLDPGHAQTLFGQLRSECSGARSGLVVTHDLNLAARYAHRIVLLHEGRIAAAGTPLEVLDSDALPRAYGVELFRGTLADGRTPFVVPA
jgi:iron complex transport system ATP-binding protein